MVHPGGLEAQRHHSRTLRRYGQIALLPPSRTGPGGVRYYDGDALLRLQRILLLRRLGLSLAVIADVLDGEQEVTDALRTHPALLEQERDRLQRRIASVRRTQLIADWTAAAEQGIAPDSNEAQVLARHHVEWLGTAPGSGPAGPAKEYVLGLGEMYVADPRFAETCGGELFPAG